MLIFIKLCGYKIVWTVHNVLPHKKMFINDIYARRFLSRIASAKIIHATSTIEELKKISINSDNCHVIPHGNFIGVYPNVISKQEARMKLKADKDDFVFLFLGKIEPYKGVENLIKIFSELNLPSTKLIIAGKCSDIGLQKKLSSYIHLPKVMIIDRFIPDKDIQLYFNAADIAVYPFERITTSSSVLLALSFGKPIIYPNLGNLKDLPKNIAYLYESNDPNGLKRCIIRVVNEKGRLKIYSARALNYAKKVSCNMIATETSNVYSKLVISK